MLPLQFLAVPCFKRPFKDTKSSAAAIYNTAKNCTVPSLQPTTTYAQLSAAEDNEDDGSGVPFD